MVVGMRMELMIPGCGTGCERLLTHEDCHLPLVSNNMSGGTARI